MEKKRPQQYGPALPAGPRKTSAQTPRPIVAQAKMSPAAPTRPSPHARTPAAPPPYRPTPTPAAAQRKAVPKAPPAYRPETKKVVQPKASAPAPTPSKRPPQAPPAYRPQPAHAVAQPKAERAGRLHAAPPDSCRPPTQRTSQAPQPKVAPHPFNPRTQPPPPARAAKAAAVSTPPRPSVPRPGAVQRVVPQGVGRRTTVQMLPVRGRLVEGAQSHHPAYHFTIGEGGTEASHDLDPWITRTAKMGYENSKYSLYVGRSDRKRLLKALNKVINAWDGARSIVHALLKEFYGVDTEGWVDWDIDPDKVPIAAAEARFSLVRHLLSLQENIMRRERDIPVNCYNVRLRTEPRVGVATTEDVTIGWTTLLREARLLLKAQMRAGAACPDGPGDVTLLRSAVQATADPGTVKMKNLELLSDEMGLSTAPKRRGANLYTASGLGALSFNFGYGHVRFILFLEWRMVDDLRKLFS